MYKLLYRVLGRSDIFQCDFKVILLNQACETFTNS